jgi:hypothetical protein
MIVVMCINNNWVFRRIIDDWYLDVQGKIAAVYVGYPYDSTTLLFRSSSNFIGVARRTPLKRSIETSTLIYYLNDSTTYFTPAGTSSGNGRVDLFYNTNGTLWYRYNNGADLIWSTPLSLAHNIVGTPSATSRGVGKIDLVVLDNTGNIKYNTYSAGSWIGWSTVLNNDFSTISSPIVLNTTLTRADYFTIDTNGNVRQKWNYAGHWSTWKNLGACDVSNSTMLSGTSPKSGIIDLVLVDMNNKLKYSNFNGTSWSLWKELDSSVMNPPTIITIEAKRTIFYQFLNGTQNELVGGCPAK